MTTVNTSAFPFARAPEEVGVSSQKMREMLAEMKQTQCHGVMVIRHGKIAAQWFRTPYCATEPHAMYSVSKSISALAIGFALKEGLLSLDDKPVDFFPESVPKHCDENLKNVTLRHLITMTAGRSISPMTSKVKNQWIDIFMQSGSSFAPGESFSYVNECFHMALAMLRGVTGVSTVDFLMPRLFAPLGIQRPYWETDHNGVEAGGWGIVLTPEDLAKIAVCFLHDGVWDNKQVIPADWIAESCVNRKGPKAKVYHNQNFGYGYGLWIRAHETFPVRFDGLFGQVAEIYKAYDAVTVIVGGDIDVAHRDVIFKYFPESFVDEQPDCEPNEFSEPLVDGQYAPIFAKLRSPLERSIEGKRITFKKNRLLNLLHFQLSVLPAAATFMSRDKAGNITDVSFAFSSNDVRFSWREGDETNSIDCGLDGQWRRSPMTLAGAPFTAFASAAWQDTHTLKLVIRPQECVCARILTFTFSGNKVHMNPESDPPIDAILNGVRGLLKAFIKNEKTRDSILEWGKRHVEPVHKGRFAKDGREATS